VNRILVTGATMAVLACTAAAQNAPPRIIVKVTDHQSRPVPGTIKLGDRLVGQTKSDGTLAFAHKCELGQLFKAEPADLAKYYNSNEQICSASVALTVFPRPQPALTTDPLTPFRVVVMPPPQIPLPQSSRQHQVYAGLFGTIQDQTEAIKNDGKERCKITLNKSVKVGYLSSQTSAWTFAPSSVPSAGKLTESETFFFQGSCADSITEIADVKTRVEADFRKNANDYMTINANRIDNSAIATMRKDNPATPPRLIKG
jgi:hypothetical protein